MPSSSSTTPPGRFPLYNPAFEHDACGIGFIASMEGEPSHRIIQLALRGLANLAHRGAVGADGSADGAGLTIQLPKALLSADATRLGLSELDHLAVAMVFLPQSEEAAARARTALEQASSEAGSLVLGWRPVPLDETVVPSVAREAMPRIEQLLLARPSDTDEAEYETGLYAARKAAEATFRREGLDEAYIVSMSAHTVVYKGLVVGGDLGAFYQDLSNPDTVSALAVFHERFATNTLPQWKMAQPFRRIAHNGEVNTLLGNKRWMVAREPGLSRSPWGRGIPSLAPVITEDASDTASLDEALDLLVTSGRGVLEAMAILIPEAWENMPGLDPEVRAFYEYHACLSEPWDGPAGVVFTDGRVVAASMDRNGLRPSRYQRTSDGLIIVGSEVGILDLPPGEVVESGRIGPGRMLAVDTVRRRFMNNSEIKRRIADRRPYATWIQENLRRLPRERTTPAAAGVEATTSTHEEISDAGLVQLQHLHGYTKEELRLVLGPMGQVGKEAIGSMGDDTPLSVLSSSQRTLYSYFRQRFAQVTNPPIDSIRERLIMSLDTYLGRRGSLVDPGPEAASRTHVPSPIATEHTLALLRDTATSGLNSMTLDASFDPTAHGPGLDEALGSLCAQAEEAVRAGTDFLVLSDRHTESGRAPIPMLLAVSTVHHHLIRAGIRLRTSLAAEAGDARDVHHIAALIGFGAAIVNPWLALATVRASAEDAEAAERAETAYVKACEAGLLKIMSKMGIASVASYHGAQIFEAIGLSDEVVSQYFPGTTSRVGGIGSDAIAADVSARFFDAHEPDASLEKGSWYRYRKGGEYHANEPPVWRALHDAVQGGGAEEYRTYADLVHDRPATSLRDLLEFVPDRDSISLDQVEPVESIVQRFQTGAMSLGALSAEAHEDIARAMNTLGALSNSGEGGEDPERYSPDGARRDANSRIKQVASGRFGVTTGYLAGAEELEIKMAQGSKPGEGGQLPGHKVSEYIARLRHVNPGTPLISPPPHHDIYSIEDLAQLIYDLKTVNPEARVAVKLVSSEGIGTIAAGVAKAYADVIHISGADGGTGASPFSSMKYAGAPWELGVAEAQQTLVRNGLRGRVTLTTDGGMHTGRDVVKAALLGAERYGFGTAALIAIGCKMARQCHSNTCPVGIATQAEELRKKYFGTPEMLVSFFLGVAGEVREILAYLGYETVDDIVGRSDILQQVEEQSDDRWAGLDLGRLTPPVADGPLRNVGQPNGRPEDRLDDQILADAAEHLANGLRFTAEYGIRNSARTVGARLSGHIAKEHGDKGLPEGRIALTFTGSAGQSFGAWLVAGVDLSLKGEANDFVGKGMTGGSISIRRADRSGIAHDGPVLAGNTLLYGATGGRLFVAGRVGERFAVRNSGATAVVEGVGKHGCEYMSGGTVVVLGPTGRNFGAGMSGGRAYVMDEFGDFEACLNPMLVESTPVDAPGDLEELRALIAEHLDRTGSARAQRILQAWPHVATRFWKIDPPPLEAPLPSAKERRIRTDAALSTPTPTRSRRSKKANAPMTRSTPPTPSSDP